MFEGMSPLGFSATDFGENFAPLVSDARPQPSEELRDAAAGQGAGGPHHAAGLRDRQGVPGHERLPTDGDGSCAGNREVILFK